MALKKLTLKTTEVHRGMRLDQALAEWLPGALSRPVSKAKARKLLVAGAVYLNGRRVRIASKELLPRATVDVYVDLSKLADDGPGRDREFRMTAERVLYEDDAVIAVDKPAGLPTQPTLDEARDNLYAAVKKFLAARDGGQPYLGLHHRLDRDTSGVVLFTKAAEANKGVADAFAKHLAEKTYQALTVLPAKGVEAEWSVRNYLGRAKTSGKKATFTEVRSGGDFAHTDFRILEELARGLWVEARPRTGRTHQIRVHLAGAGLPILGDTHYGGPAEASGIRIPRVMLHAACLTFPHPIHHSRISVPSRPPEDFAQCLQALKKQR